MTDFAVKKGKKSGKNDSRTVCLTGDMTIMHVGEARDALLDLFASEQRICIDIKGIKEIDLTGLQLLCAAHRAAVAAQKTLTIEGAGNAVFDAAARGAGFPRRAGCMNGGEKGCFWVGGE